MTNLISMFQRYLNHLIFIAPLLLLSGCSAMDSTRFRGDCKIQTYIDQGVVDYISSRFHKGQPARIAIVPFDVPESFAPIGTESQNYGRELARNFQAELLASGEFGIVELFNRDRWPGKREDFFSGNYGAINISRDAGYDIVVVGYLENIKNAADLTLDTKFIDTESNVTIWSGKTGVHSSGRDQRDAIGTLNKLSNWFKDRPELFDFAQRSDELIRCTVQRIVRGPDAGLAPISTTPSGF